MDLRTMKSILGKMKNIKRFQMEHVIHTQDLGNHGHGVASVFYRLYHMSGVVLEELSAKDMFIVMNHDLAETFTGDLNTVIKNRNASTKEAWTVIEREGLPEGFTSWSDEGIEASLGSEKYALFCLADMIDALWYCEREASIGNSHAERIAQYYRGKIVEWSRKHDLIASSEIDELIEIGRPKNGRV